MIRWFEFQRSRELEKVRDQLEREGRNVFGREGIQEVKKASGRGTVGNLIQVIHGKDFLTKEYHFMMENCKHFAAEIFDHCSNGSCSVGFGWFADLPHPSTRC